MTEEELNAKRVRAPSQSQIDAYAMLFPMLESALVEMREFSKKKQDGIVNETKISLLNRLLRQLKDVLSKEPSIAYLDLLDDTQLPQNGDVVLILGQFKAALEGFRTAHFVWVERTQRWVTAEWLDEQVRFSSDDDNFEDDDDAADADDGEGYSEQDDEQDDDDDEAQA